MVSVTQYLFCTSNKLTYKTRIGQKYLAISVHRIATIFLTAPQQGEPLEPLYFFAELSLFFSFGSGREAVEKN